MKVLLVYPEYPDTFWSFKHVLSFVSKKAAFPPLGLLTIAAMLPPEWEKKLVDANVSKLMDEQILWADMVFISAMIVQKENAAEIIQRCKSLGRKVVAGGPFFTTQHENFPQVDCFVLNEAEVTLPLFLEDLKNGKLKHVYTSTERPDITKTPLPLWDLIRFRDYATMLVQHSRGCPFNCEFCDIVIMNGNVPRTKAAGQFMTELTSLYNAGWRGGVFIVDDNFIGNKINVKKMLPLLVAWQKAHHYPFTFLTEASTNLADDQELMSLMSAANFNKVFLGIETPNVDSLKECGKFQNVSRNLVDTIRVIQRNGMQVMGGFIVGFDSDTESVFDAQINFIQQVGVVTAMVGLLAALPQTRLWHRLKAEGRLLAETTGNHMDGSMNFVPKMRKEKLIAGYRRIMSTIYSPKFYYPRIETLIRNYKHTARSRVSWGSVKAFFESMWRIGIFSRAGPYYWRLLFKIFFTRIKSFPLAVELSVYGFHFEKCARKAASASY